MTTLYGIANCDTIKRAKTWLTEHEIAYEFHDYKKLGIDQDTLRHWFQELGWEALLNRRGTTWRKLPLDIKEQINEEQALKIMLENPSIIKRPILKKDNGLHLGFKAQEYQAFFQD